MSNFKTIFIIVFAAAAIFGILVFSGAISVGSRSATTEIQGSVTVWGTFDSASLSGFISDFNTRNQKISLLYVEKDPALFDASLIEAIAAGTPPDLVLLPDNLVWRYQDKLTHIPFASLPAQTFQNTFVSSANVFAATDGYVAVPWAADPLVMYYNRDLLESAGIVNPPTNWQAFVDSVPLLAKKETDLTLTQEATALGAFGNIAHAKDILAMLFFENNNKFVAEEGGQLAVHFGSTGTGTDLVTSTQALEFYMSFSDARKPTYTWNSGKQLDREAFVQSTLAYYFGTASELPLIRAQNPNLNFGISLPPQAMGAVRVTSGRTYGFAIPKSAPNQLLAYTAATLLANTVSQSALTTATGADLALIPVRRDVLAAKPANDPYVALLYDAALVQRSWMDPNPITSSQVFATLVRDVASATLSTGDALSKAAATLLQLGAKI